MLLSVTGHLLTKVNAFRNDDIEDPKRSALESLGRRVVGGLGYAALAVAALVEMVVRSAIGLLLLLPCALVACCACDGNIFAAPLFLGVVVGLGLGPEVTIRCLSAFVQNCYRGEIQYNDLPPCGTCVDF